MTIILQLVMLGAWGMTLVTHMRRLLRLARVEQLRNWGDNARRLGLNRIWWWLGQNEFWHGVTPDCLKAIEITAIVVLIAWGISQ
jgi:hypothetical protein